MWLISFRGPNLHAVALCGIAALLAAGDPDKPARHAVAGHYNVPNARAADATAAKTPNQVTNGDFETGGVDGGWFQCGDVSAYTTREHPHGGAYDEYSGTITGVVEPTGNSGICQAIAIPPGGVLTAHLYQLSNEPDTSFAYQEADLLDDRGDVVLNLYKAVNNKPAWIRGSWNLSAYAGKAYWLYFGVHGDGNSKHATQQFVDDVDMRGSSLAPAEKSAYGSGPDPRARKRR